MPQCLLTDNPMNRFFSFAVALVAAAWLCLVPFSAAQSAILITIDKAAQKMTVNVDGDTRWIWPVSTGRRGYDTPSGNFRPFRMEEDHYSKEWDDAPMPYSIFFTGEGHAIHGSYETRNLGRAASHGCVRISPSNAAKLFALVKREGLEKARVVVTGDADAPAVAKRRAPEAPTTQQARTAPKTTPSAVAVPAQQSYGYVRQPTANPFVADRPDFELPAAAANGPQRYPGW
jgi:hypothetical protein